MPSSWSITVEGIDSRGNSATNSNARGIAALQPPATKCRRLKRRCVMILLCGVCRWILTRARVIVWHRMSGSSWECPTPSGDCDGFAVRHDSVVCPTAPHTEVGGRTTWQVSCAPAGPSFFMGSGTASRIRSFSAVFSTPRRQLHRLIALLLWTQPGVLSRHKVWRISTREWQEWSLAPAQWGPTPSISRIPDRCGV